MPRELRASEWCRSCVWRLCLGSESAGRMPLIDCHAGSPILTVYRVAVCDAALRPHGPSARPPRTHEHQPGVDQPRRPRQCRRRHARTNSRIDQATYHHCGCYVSPCGHRWSMLTRQRSLTVATEHHGDRRAMAAVGSYSVTLSGWCGSHEGFERKSPL